jgi:hypothetical protein
MMVILIALILSSFIKPLMEGFREGNEPTPETSKSLKPSGVEAISADECQSGKIIKQQYKSGGSTTMKPKYSYKTICGV